MEMAMAMAMMCLSVCKVGLVRDGMYVVQKDIE